jgi:hypothetical protein
MDCINLFLFSEYIVQPIKFTQGQGLNGYFKQGQLSQGEPYCTPKAY